MTQPRQHPKVAQLQQRMEDARRRGDSGALHDAQAQLRRIEIRDLSPEQVSAQADYIARQCEERA